MTTYCYDYSQRLEQRTGRTGRVGGSCEYAMVAARSNSRDIRNIPQFQAYLQRRGITYEQWLAEQRQKRRGHAKQRGGSRSVGVEKKRNPPRGGGRSVKTEKMRLALLELL